MTKNTHADEVNALFVKALKRGKVRFTYQDGKFTVRGSLGITAPELTELPEHLEVTGDMSAWGLKNLRILPRKLVVGKCLSLEYLHHLTKSTGSLSAAWIEIKHCNGLTEVSGETQSGHLIIEGCPKLKNVSTVSRPHPKYGGVYVGLRDLNSLERLPDNWNIPGKLHLDKVPNLKALPENLTVENLIMDRCPKVRQLPASLKTADLNIECCEGITEITHPGISGEIKVQNCPSLRKISGSAAENVKAMGLENCPVLEELPQKLHVEEKFVMTKCPSLRQLPRQLNVDGHAFIVGNPGLQSLSDHMRVNGMLDLSDCGNLQKLSDDLVVTHDIILHGCKSLENISPRVIAQNFRFLGDTKVKKLPAGLRQVMTHEDVSSLTELAKDAPHFQVTGGRFVQKYGVERTSSKGKSLQEIGAIYHQCAMWCVPRTH